jgi:hypothetical protein
MPASSRQRSSVHHSPHLPLVGRPCGYSGGLALGSPTKVRAGAHNSIQAAMPCLSATVTVHRFGLLASTSIIERIIPATGNPFNITTAFSPRYWA